MQNQDSNNYIHIYVDESGSMKIGDESQKYFIIALVHVKNVRYGKKFYKKLLKSYPYFFVTSNNKKEIHACKLTREIKLELADKLCRNDLFEVFYIKVCNDKIIELDLYQNKARAFNYFIERNFEALLNANIIPKNSKISLIIDNRNVAVQSLNSLEDYLNICLHTSKKLVKNIIVSYRDSLDVNNLQFADFFSNFMYCYLHSKHHYLPMMKRFIKTGVIKSVFDFPPIKYK